MNRSMASAFCALSGCLRTFSRIGTETAETLLDPTQLRHQRSSSSCGAMGHHAWLRIIPPRVARPSPFSS